MALAVDSEQASNVGFGVAGSPVASPQTFSFTNTAGTVLYLFVGIGLPGADTITLGAVSYAGVAMTKILETTTSGGATGGKIAVYRLLGPATGSNTVSIAFTLSTGDTGEVFAGCISFTGNDTTTPEAQSGANHGSSSTAALTLAGVVAGNISVVAAGAGTSMSAQAQTLSWAKNVDDNSSMGNGRSSRSTSTGSVAHSFTIGGADSWAAVGVEVAAAGGGSNKAVTPAAITSTSAMSGAVRKLAAVKPAAITASSAMSGNVQALKQVKSAAITSTSAVSGTVTKLGTKAIVPAAITSTSTVSGVVVKLAAVKPGAIIATSTMTGSISGSSTTKFAVWSRFYKGFTGVYPTLQDATNAKWRRLSREVLDEVLDLYGLPASATTGTTYHVLVRHWDGADRNVSVEHIATTDQEAQAMLRRRITHGGRLADYETYTVDR